MRFTRQLAAALTAGALVSGVLAGCSSKNQVPSIGYAVDAAPVSYNGGSALGANGGAAAVFSRVLTGFFYTGPDGQPVADTDFGTAKEVPGEAQTIQYRLNPDGVYSDGVPTSCDDLVLEWAARSGRYKQFDAASTAGYSDIERVDCQPGSKDATVVFRPDRHFLAWKTLFNAGDLMPAHIAAQAAGIPNVVSAVQSRDQAVLDRLAQFWNTGWNLKPGNIDTKLLPSSGPYRVESFSDSDGLVLVKNDKWWGDAAKTPRVVVWTRASDLAKKISDKAVGVVDVGAGSIKDLSLNGFSVRQVPGRGAEQLVLATGGPFASPDVRRAFAACVPRQALFDELGHPGFDAKSGLGSGLLNSRTVQQDSPYYPAVTGPADKYRSGDAAAARQGLGNQNPTVRIGYRTPDDRRAQTVAMIAEACKPAGITVVDAGAPDFVPTQLSEGKVDAVLGGTAAAPGPSGSLPGIEAVAALHGGQGLNFGRYGNGRYDAIADQLAADENSTTVLNLDGEAENLLWNDMPSIPLFATPRTIAFGEGMENGIANPTKAGSGWNMDRWVLQR
ncbi:ABC transporter substrate-binding protein [Nocardia sp. CDC159]|uniref:ABC transporter substrate-binding protein n=1 Tax=Nocardia pulmonis TaxID=2951408 RepID=A0A9X2E853_9NOCA|nr:MULTISPECIES: ABC transporter substrate-binding protein [Nocardia]MCM6774645.1 ABC transporter substrate-binding protein [Nocardia pulmonis]MCM6787290.1 ABC transporter substrate-binding protein [Nocardia sp. CDC159]